MKNWTAIINYLGNILEVRIRARSYENVYRRLEKMYPGCLIKSITEIHFAIKKKKNTLKIF
jgi:hypothetical protein